MFEKYNPNPAGKHVEDHMIRAIAKALDIDWEAAYIKIVMTGFDTADAPLSRRVLDAVLRKAGFSRAAISNTCSDYTVVDFCRDNPRGIYVLDSSGYLATVIDGILFDSWDSSQNIPQFYWYAENSSRPAGPEDSTIPQLQ